MARVLGQDAVDQDMVVLREGKTRGHSEENEMWKKSMTFVTVKEDGPPIGKWVVLPNNILRMGWDVQLLFLLFYIGAHAARVQIVSTDRCRRPRTLS